MKGTTGNVSVFFFLSRLGAAIIHEAHFPSAMTRFLILLILKSHGSGVFLERLPNDDARIMLYKNVTPFDFSPKYIRRIAGRKRFIFILRAGWDDEGHHRLIVVVVEIAVGKLN